MIVLLGVDVGRDSFADAVLANRLRRPPHEAQQTPARSPHHQAKPITRRAYALHFANAAQLRV